MPKQDGFMERFKPKVGSLEQDHTATLEDVIDRLDNDPELHVFEAPDLLYFRKIALDQLLIPSSGIKEMGCTRPYSRTLIDDQIIDSRILWVKSSALRDGKVHETIVIWPVNTNVISSDLQPEASQIPVQIVFDNQRGSHYFETSKKTMDNSDKIHMNVRIIEDPESVSVIINELGWFAENYVPIDAACGDHGVDHLNLGLEDFSMHIDIGPTIGGVAGSIGRFARRLPQAIMR